MSDCKRTQNSMSYYLEGLLEGGRIKAVETHLQQCSECAGVCDRMQRTVEVLGGLQEIVPSPSFEQNLRESLRLERARSHHRVWDRLPSVVLARPRPAFVLAMAVVAMGVGVFLLKGSFFQRESRLFVSDERPTRGERVETLRESTRIGAPLRLVSHGDEVPNYVLRRVSPQILELRREYLSPSWEAHVNREYVLEQVQVRRTSDGEHIIEYVLASAPPQKRLKATSFSP
ncbi:MAG: anti-sigma factor family protein [bacterium]